MSLLASKPTSREAVILRSIELNLNPRGEGDMDEQSLASLDVVLGCFHSSLRKKEDRTERCLAPLRNPMIQILGHPRGRICYNCRLGLSSNLPQLRMQESNANASRTLGRDLNCRPGRLVFEKRQGA